MNTFLKLPKIHTCIWIILIGITLTHYTERYQIKLLKPIRNLIYFGSFYSIETENGIVKKKYNNLSHSQINPVTITNKVDSFVGIILNQNRLGKPFNNILSDKQKNEITNTSNFLIEYGKLNITESMEYFLLPYNFDLQKYDQTLKAPWYSGMAQGNAIKTMLASFLITNNNKYLNYAKLLANALSIPIDSNGVSIYLSKQKIWFEEYACSGVKPPFVLNGHNFALIGLFELAHFDNSYKDLFEKGLNSLETELPKFNAFVWSRYDLQKYIANPNYHQLHINQLNFLGNLTGSDFLLKYARIFEIQKYVPLGVYFRLFFYPHRFLVINVLFNIAFIGFIYASRKKIRKAKNRS